MMNYPMGFQVGAKSPVPSIKSPLASPAHPKDGNKKKVLDIKYAKKNLPLKGGKGGRFKKGDAIRQNSDPCLHEKKHAHGRKSKTIETETSGENNKTGSM